VDGGDVVVIRDKGGRPVVARVESTQSASLTVIRERPDADDVWPRVVPRDDVIGRVWLAAR
jgi:hypothetical protein